MALLNSGAAKIKHPGREGRSSGVFDLCDERKILHQGETRVFRGCVRAQPLLRC